MAEIIDLDFYRKFRIILPVRQTSSKKEKAQKSSSAPPKGYQRRQKGDSELSIPTKE